MPSKNTAHHSDRCLLDMKQVCERISFNKSYVFRLVKEGRFPAPIKIGQKASRWTNIMVDDWITEQEKARAQ